MALGYWQNNILMPFLLAVALDYEVQQNLL